MATMARRIFNALAVISFLGCVFTIALWVRSDSWRDDWKLQGQPNYACLDSYEGEIWVYWVTGNLVGGPYQSREFFGLGIRRNCVMAISETSHSQPEPAAAAAVTPGPFFAASAVGVQDWFLALAFAIAPILRFRPHLARNRRLRAGHCQSCGYDLRATPDRCPECGIIPPKIDGRDPTPV
jgi:hypothetical protein